MSFQQSNLGVNKARLGIEYLLEVFYNLNNEKSTLFVKSINKKL